MKKTLGPELNVKNTKGLPDIRLKYIYDTHRADTHDCLPPCAHVQTPKYSGGRRAQQSHLLVSK